MQLLSHKSNLYFSHEFPLAVSPQRNQADIALHAHDFMELVVIISGSGLHYTASEEHPIRPGDVFVIPPGLSHGYRNTHSLRLVNILFDLSWFDRLTAEIPKKTGFYPLFKRYAQAGGKPQNISRLHLDARQFANVKSLLRSFQLHLGTKQQGNNLSATGLLLEIVGFLSSRYKSTPAAPVSSPKVDMVMEYIYSKYGQEISLQQLADVAKISPRNLLRIFRNATGTTPIDYLLHYRISRACRLLAETDRPVTSVAFDVGFSDGNYFCRQFRKIIRISPARYRSMRSILR